MNQMWLVLIGIGAILAARFIWDVIRYYRLMSALAECVVDIVELGISQDTALSIAKNIIAPALKSLKKKERKETVYGVVSAALRKLEEQGTLPRNQRVFANNCLTEDSGWLDYLARQI